MKELKVSEVLRLKIMLRDPEPSVETLLTGHLVSEKHNMFTVTKKKKIEGLG